jgi:hypothetical protein
VVLEADFKLICINRETIVIPISWFCVLLYCLQFGVRLFNAWENINSAVLMQCLEVLSSLLCYVAIHSVDHLMI